MLLLAADENFNGNIVWGLFRRQPALDLVRLQHEVLFFPERFDDYMAEDQPVRFLEADVRSSPGAFGCAQESMQAD